MIDAPFGGLKIVERSAVTTRKEVDQLVDRQEKDKYATATHQIHSVGPKSETHEKWWAVAEHVTLDDAWLRIA